MYRFGLFVLLIYPLFLHSEGASDTDSEVEDRVDGVKSWLSKNKGSAKNLSDDGSLKSSRSVLQSFFLSVTPQNGLTQTQSSKQEKGVWKS